MTQRRRARLLAIAGRLIVAVALIAAAMAARRNFDDVSDVVGDATPPLLALALAGAIAAVGLLALPWSAAMRAVGTRRPFGDIAGWFAAGQIGKYVPGGVWHLVGQGELARRAGVPARLAYGSIALSNLGIVAGGATLVAVGGLSGAVDGTPWWIAAVGVAALALLAIPAVRRRACRILRLDAESALGLRSLLGLSLAALPAWAAIGVTTWLVSRSFDAEMPFGTVAVAAVASWLAGILTLPAPGGLGVREAAFVAITGSHIGTPAASVVAVSARLVFVVADVVCWVSARLLLGVAARRGASSTAAG